MKFPETKKVLIGSILAGFLLGILFADFIADSYVVQTDLFSEYYLKEFLGERTYTIEYGIYLTAMRIIPIIMLIAIQHTRIAKGVVWLFLLWTGFSCGLLMSVELMNLGSAGVLFYLTGIFPQIIFLIPAYGIVIVQITEHQGKSWNRGKIYAFLLFLALALFAEYFVNPILIKAMIHLLY